MYEKNELTLIPKYEKYMEYMLEIILIKLPRTEKFSIGNEYKTIMYQTFENIMYIDKLPVNLRLGYLNRIDAELNVLNFSYLEMARMNKFEKI